MRKHYQDNNSLLSFNFNSNGRSGHVGLVGCGMIIPLFVGLIFSIVGGCLVFMWGIPQLQNAKASTSWPIVKGEVILAEVVRSRNDDGVSYRPDIQFKYTVDGEEYEASNVRYDGDWSTNDSSYANQTVKKYKKGTEVDVYYNPEDPFEAVLEPGTTWFSYFPIAFGGVFLVVGGLCVFLGTLGSLFFGIAVAGRAATGMIGKNSSQGTQDSFDDSYDNDDNWGKNEYDSFGSSDDDTYRNHNGDHDDGFENL